MERSDGFDDIYDLPEVTPPTPHGEEPSEESAEETGAQSAGASSSANMPGPGPSSAPRGDAAASRDADPVAVAAARDRLEAAEFALRAAETEHDAAEDALADAEGAVAVAEFKVDDYDNDDQLRDWEKASAHEELGHAKRTYSRAISRLSRAAIALEDAQAEVDRAAEGLRRAEQTPAPAPEKPVQRFASLPVFVEEYVVPNWVHKLGDNYAGRWCSHWWEHPEAVTRLSAVWEAFEVMRLEPPPSLSTWIKDHLDAHMAALTALHGVFHNCDVGRHIHEPRRPWETEHPPEGMFQTDEDALVQGRAKQDSTDQAAGSAVNGVSREEMGEIHVGRV